MIFLNIKTELSMRQETSEFAVQKQKLGKKTSKHSRLMKKMWVRFPGVSVFGRLQQQGTNIFTGGPQKLKVNSLRGHIWTPGLNHLKIIGFSNSNQNTKQHKRNR